MSDKEEKLKEIELLLEKYGGKLEISSYVLQYLTLEELETIQLQILRRQDNVIEENSKWLEQFKKEI